VCTFKQLCFGNHSELDKCSYEFSFAQWPILSTSKILTIPCELPCIHPEAPQGHSSEADSSSASRDIPHILWWKVLYCGHKCPPPVPILGAKGSVPVLGFVPVWSCVFCFIICSVFMVRIFQPLTHSPSWRTTSCKMSMPAYSTYLQLPSIFGGFLRHSQREDTSCCGDRDHFIWETEV